MEKKPFISIAILTLYPVIVPWVANMQHALVDKIMASLSNAVILANLVFFIGIMIYTNFLDRKYPMKKALCVILFLPYVLLNIAKALWFSSFMPIIDWVGVGLQLWAFMKLIGFSHLFFSKS